MAVEHHNAGVTVQEAVTDLKLVAEKLNKQTVTQEEYSHHGRLSTKPLIRHFGSWRKALESSVLFINSSPMEKPKPPGSDQPTDTVLCPSDRRCHREPESLRQISQSAGEARGKSCRQRHHLRDHGDYGHARIHGVVMAPAPMTHPSLGLPPPGSFAFI